MLHCPWSGTVQLQQSFCPCASGGALVHLLLVPGISVAVCRALFVLLGDLSESHFFAYAEHCCIVQLHVMTQFPFVLKFPHCYHWLQ